MEERPFAPTSRRLREARRTGKVLRTPVFILAVCGLGLSAVGLFAFKFIWLHFQILLKYLLTSGFSDVRLSIGRSVILALEISATVIGCWGILSIAVQTLQNGIGWYLPLRGIDVVEGSRKVIKDVRAVHRVVLKVLCILAVSLFVLFSLFEGIMSLSLVQSAEKTAVISFLLVRFWSCLIGAVLLFGGIEFVSARRRFRADLKMTHYEVRKELREAEGDPGVKALREHLHRLVLTREVIKRVRNSRVLVVERA